MSASDTLENDSLDCGRLATRKLTAGGAPGRTVGTVLWIAVAKSPSHHKRPKSILENVTVPHGSRYSENGQHVYAAQ